MRISHDCIGGLRHRNKFNLNLSRNLKLFNVPNKSALRSI